VARDDACCLECGSEFNALCVFPNSPPHRRRALRPTSATEVEQRAEKVTQSRLAGRVRGRECVGAAELGTRKNRGFACVRPLLVASSCAARA